MRILQNSPLLCSLWEHHVRKSPPQLGSECSGLDLCQHSWVDLLSSQHQFWTWLYRPRHYFCLGCHSWSHIQEFDFQFEFDSIYLWTAHFGVSLCFVRRILTTSCAVYREVLPLSYMGISGITFQNSWTWTHTRKKKTKNIYTARQLNLFASVRVLMFLHDISEVISLSLLEFTLISIILS